MMLWTNKFYPFPKGSSFVFLSKLVWGIEELERVFLVADIGLGLPQVTAAASYSLILNRLLGPSVKVGGSGSRWCPTILSGAEPNSEPQRPDGGTELVQRPMW